MYCTMNENKMKLLEIAIDYFNDYANKNFIKNSYKLNWYNIFNIIINSGLYTYYEEFDEIYNLIIKNEIVDEDILKEKAHNFFNILIEKGEKISDFYSFTDMEECERIKKREYEIKYKLQKDKFKSIKCFKCKYFKDHITVLDNGTYEYTLGSIMKATNMNFEQIKNYYFVNHKYVCEKRDELIEELKKNDTYPFEIENRINKKLDENNEPENFKFTFNKYNKPNPFILKLVLKDENCKYFSDTNISFDDYIKNFYEI